MTFIGNNKYSKKMKEVNDATNCIMYIEAALQVGDNKTAERLFNKLDCLIEIICNNEN